MGTGQGVRHPNVLLLDEPAPVLTLDVGGHAHRPFLLVACAYAVVALLAWLAWLAVVDLDIVPPALSIREPAPLWHAHEMIFGFGAAMAAGLLFVALPALGGGAAPRGRMLVNLFVLWALGRAALWFTIVLPAAAVAVLDMLFLPVLLVQLAVRFERLTTPERLALALPLLLMIVGNGLGHADRLGLMSSGINDGNRLALDGAAMLAGVLVAILIAAARGARLRDLPGLRALLPPYLLVSLGVGLATAFAAPAPAIAGLSALAAVLALAIGGAAGKAPGSGQLTAGGMPRLATLTLAFLALGYGLRALAAVDLGLAETDALHAHAIGALGAVACQAIALALVPTANARDRALRLAPPVLLIAAAAVIRVIAPGLLPALWTPAMLAAGLLWVIAWSFVLVAAGGSLSGAAVPRSG